MTQAMTTRERITRHISNPKSEIENRHE